MEHLSTVKHQASTQPEYFEPIQEESISVDNGQNERLGFVRRNAGKLALAAGITSVSATLAMNPLKEIGDQAGDAAPLIAGSLVGGEVAWVGGAVMMLAAVGDKIGNPLKLRDQVKSIAAKANDSRLFAAGLWINTIGATAQFVVPVGAVVAEMPPQSWPLPLSLLSIDFAGTIALRRLIISGIRQNNSLDHNSHKRYSNNNE